MTEQPLDCSIAYEAGYDDGYRYQERMNDDFFIGCFDFYENGFCKGLEDFYHEEQEGKG